MGPVTLFDKSFLQALTVDESVWFDHFFYTVVCPLFYVETLADLSKKFENDKDPEREVSKIADKFPDMSGNPCAYHLDLCLRNLLGFSVPMTGQIPRTGGRPIKAEGKSGVVYEKSPEADAFLRWRQEKFFEVEYTYASAWRQSLSSLNLDDIEKTFHNFGVNEKSCKYLEDAKAISQAVVNNSEKPVEVMKLACILLRIPILYHKDILERWQSSNCKRFEIYAPYAAFVLTVELFFQIAIASKLIRRHASSYVDTGYLCYLPFCTIFVSTDKLHKRCASLFMRDNQQFVWGVDLKEDLQKLNIHYEKLPDSIKEKGIMSFARTPPKKGNFLVAEIWDKNFPRWRERREIDPESIKHLNLGAEITRMSESPTLPASEVDFDLQHPETTTIKRNTRRKKGSWYQIPKEI